MPRKRSWTDDDLREAVRTSTTMKEVVSKLKAKRGSAGYRTVRTRIVILQLDLDHFTSAPGPRGTDDRIGPDQEPDPVASPWRTWTYEDLEAAVARATSLKGVFDQLRLAVGGSQWSTIRQVIRQTGLSTDHWVRPLGARAGTGTPMRSRTVEAIRSAVQESRSLAAALRALELPVDKTSYRWINQQIDDLGLDTGHMTGQGWARGRTNPAGRPKRPIEEILVENSDYAPTSRLRDRLLDEGLKGHRCEECHRTEWNGQPIPLHLDHVNGDRRDNRLDNLRLLCPNCHAQTDTYCGRNIGRYD